MNSSLIWSVNAYVSDDSITATATTTGDTIVQFATALSTIILNSTSTLSSSLSTVTTSLLSEQSSTSSLSSPPLSSSSISSSSSLSSSSTRPPSSSSSAAATVAAASLAIASSTTSSSLSVSLSPLSTVMFTNDMEVVVQDDCRFRPTIENYITIVSFCIIFCLSVVGNAIVVAVILQQHSMRSVTNIYLLNLAISDLMLSVICMPPTLVSSVIYCWMFGDLLCKLFAYLQPVVVTASAYTLAVIAFERYYAICKPLHSRIWHTRSHAYTMITLVWLISVLANLFMLFMFELQTYNVNGLTCAPKHRPILHFGYQIYMTSVLLLIPLCIMIVLYGSVIHALRIDMKMHTSAPTTDSVVTTRNDEQQQPCKDEISGGLKMFKSKNRKNTNCFYTSLKQIRTSSDATALSVMEKNKSVNFSSKYKNSLRSTHSERSILAKQRVIKMLIVIVIIFFCCWTPNYMWWLLLTAQDSFRTFDIWNSRVNTAITVLCYISSCANPITYCFLNKKFRTALLITFGCVRKTPNHFPPIYLPEAAIDKSARKKSTEKIVLQTEKSNQNNQSSMNVIHSKMIIYRTSSATTPTGYQQGKRSVLE
ncbi:7 transmembrane receptor (rhodopsin family) protein [Acanthocheilonema viteae]